MFTMSARFLAGLSGVPRWIRVVEWSNDGLTWAPATLHGGNVAQDATSQVRWSIDAEVSGVPVGRGGVSAFGTLLRARVGMVYRPGDVEWVPLGVFRCEKVRRSLTGATVAVSGASLEAAVIDAEFPAPRILARGTSSAVVGAVIREVIPSASMRWLLADPDQPRIATSTSRWGVVDGSTDDPSIARALGGVVFCDRIGTFVAAPVPSVSDTPVWTAEQGPGGVLLSAVEELSRDGMFNVVSVTGESTDPDTPPVGPGIASDDDPNSVTYSGGDPARGGCGPVVFHYSSPLLKTLNACQDAARSLLAPRLGLKQQIEFAAAPNPALDAGDVIWVRNPAGLTPTILDSLELDLGSMAQTGRCRAGVTRAAGDVSDLPTSQEAM